MAQPASLKDTLPWLETDGPVLMGIVNVTPDSFSDGGQFDTTAKAVEHALRLVGDGADILDIGGESTRPGADPVSVETELARVIPVIEELRPLTKAALSIDTRKAAVMHAALDAGADLINDVTALEYDAESIGVAAESACPVVLMHGKGDPKTMQDNPVYEDVLGEVLDYLQKRIETCVAAGISRARLIVDPGIGFGKTLEHNLTLLGHLERFHELGVPVLLGASRKRFIGVLSGEQDPLRRMSGSVAAALAGLRQGIQIFRVHDVAETQQAFAVWRAVERYVRS